jgi:PTS system ascorbate-specific IIC component
MNIALAIVQFLVNEILSVPAFLIGIITAVGLAAMRKSIGQIAGAAIKATLGFLLIGAGAGLVVNSLGPLGKMIEGALGAQGVVPTNEAIAGIAQQQFGSQVAWIMLAGFLISLVLARITPLHYVFLTGHHMLFMATLITIVMASTSMPTSIVIGLGSLLLGVLMVSLPALAHPFTRKITGGEDIAIGHFGTSAYIAAAATGRLVDPHGKSQSTENIKVPEGLRFLRDSMVATALSMVLMYVVVAIVFLARRGEKAAFQTFSKPEPALETTSWRRLLKGSSSASRWPSFSLASAPSSVSSSLPSRESPARWSPAPSQHSTVPSSFPTLRMLSSSDLSRRSSEGWSG